jgi:hypothetical protein
MTHEKAVALVQLMLKLGSWPKWMTLHIWWGAVVAALLTGEAKIKRLMDA